MILKSAVILEEIKDERVYRYEIPIGAPFVDAHSVALQMAAAVEHMAKEAEEKARKETDGD